MQADVRISEAPDFPNGVTSHDACLRALEGCHLAIVIIGGRYGGPYAGTPKSITWREYDEARRLGIPTVVLVLGSVTAEAERWSKGKLMTGPFGADTDAIIKFLGHVRKGHIDNWIHPEWDGTFHKAKQLIQSRINSLFVRYQAPHTEVVERAKRLPQYAEARRKLDQVVQVLAGMQATPQSKLTFLLDAVAEERGALLGYEPEDRWNVAIYTPSPGGRSLRVLARRAHPDISLSNRKWKIGEGHVGSTWEQGKTLVAADLTVTTSWAGAREGDEENYRSAVAEPIIGRDNRKKAILVATSSRMDHFRDPDQPEIATVSSLALYVSRLI